MREMQNLSKIAKTSVREVKNVVGNVQSKNKLKEVVFATMQSVGETKSPTATKGPSKRKSSVATVPIKPKSENKGTNTLSAGIINRDVQTEISRHHMIHMDEKMGEFWWGAGGGTLEGDATGRQSDQTQFRLNSPTGVTIIHEHTVQHSF